ncbi:PAS and ANTAR domain-containing protein [Nocardia sp. NPDC049220]|uniref:PAS and ANTAR domain-containing protein n=1 Tax=Nocardia sp. NPDC049220 TaxID=3155273 RepID=UPI0033DC84F1
MGQREPDTDRMTLGGCPRSIGSFRFWFADQRWEWSDEVAAMHGYSLDAVEPTTELLLSHQYPDDREQVATALAAAIETGEAFCSRHRVVDTSGELHDVIVIGDQMCDQQDAVVGTMGYYLDVTETLEENRREAVDDLLPDLVDARAVIEQAKGIIMFVYGLNAEHAFGVLRWRSQETNIKIRVLSEQLVSDVVAAGGALTQQRTRFDHLLLTIQQRVAPTE